MTSSAVMSARTLAPSSMWTVVASTEPSDRALDAQRVGHLERALQAVGPADEGQVGGHRRRWSAGGVGGGGDTDTSRTPGGVAGAAGGLPVVGRGAFGVATEHLDPPRRHGARGTSGPMACQLTVGQCSPARPHPPRSGRAYRRRRSTVVRTGYPPGTLIARHDPEGDDRCPSPHTDDRAERHRQAAAATEQHAKQHHHHPKHDSPPVAAPTTPRSGQRRRLEQNEATFFVRHRSKLAAGLMVVAGHHLLHVRVRLHPVLGRIRRLGGRTAGRGAWIRTRNQSDISRPL